MALIDTDKNGLGAGSHRQPGSAEALLGSSLLEQHPTALIETPLQGGARAAFVIYFFEEYRIAHRANSFK